MYIVQEWVAMTRTWRDIFKSEKIEEIKKCCREHSCTNMIRVVKIASYLVIGEVDKD